jgi:predicted metal-dependent hydrolase
MNIYKTKSDFKQRVLYYANEIDIKVNSISIRPMKNKWASCSTKGNLSFNQELLNKSKKIIDYVIVHELLHFRVPNHGKLWKALMMAYIGDYKKIEGQLKNSKIS